MATTRKNHPYTQVILHFDGATRGGNPGLGGAGAIVSINDDNTSNEVRVHNRMGLVGSNCAEYYGLILGLREVLHMFPASPFDLTIKGDSELVIKQITGKYQVQNDTVRSYHLVAVGLLGRIKKLITTSLGVTLGLGDERGCKITLLHIPREQNGKADSLAKKAAAMEVHPNLRFFHYPCIGWFLDGVLEGQDGVSVPVKIAHDIGAAAYTPQVYIDSHMLQTISGDQALKNLRSTGKKILLQGQAEMTILGITSITVTISGTRVSVYDALVVDFLPWPLQVSFKHPSFDIKKIRIQYDSRSPEHGGDWRDKVPARYRNHPYYTSDVQVCALAS